MKGAILAAGRGERLRGRGVLEPKPLVTVLGKTIFDRVVDGMRAAGAREVCCVTNEDFAPLLAGRPGVRLVARDTPCSMESLFALAPLLGTETFLLSTVDAVFRPEQMAGLVRTARGDGTLAVTDDSGGDKPLRLLASTDGRVTAVGPAAGRSPTITAGFYVLSGNVFAEMGEARARGLVGLRQFLGLLAEKGYRLYAHHVGRTVDVDTPGEIAAAEEFLKS